MTEKKKKESLYLQIDNDEIHDGAARGHRTVLFALLVDHQLGLHRRRNLVLHLQRLALGVAQHANQLAILQQVALGVHTTGEKGTRLKTTKKNRARRGRSKVQKAEEREKKTLTLRRRKKSKSET